MKELAKHLLPKGLPVALAAMTLLVTGCPHNQYIVQLQPQGNTIDRTLVFYREDGADTNTGQPNYKAFPEDELAAIVSLYPAKGLSNDGERHIVRGAFTNLLPSDVGGAGVYTNLTTSLGEAGFYIERFRGNDDLAAMSERRAKAANQLADVFVGWSQAELGGQPGYDNLRHFLNVDFRRDLKNLGEYWWEGRLTGAYNTNASEEFYARFGQYLLERGYFTLGEMPRLFRETQAGGDPALFHRIQRLVARKMGVLETEPIPAALAFLSSDDTMKTSFDKYLASTDLYRTALAQWRWEEDKHPNPDDKPPQPSDVAGDIVGNLLEFDSNLFGQADHLTIKLALPSAPLHGNGRWDEARRQMVWETDLGHRTNDSHLSFSCYANWARANEASQKEHFGKVVLTGDDLTQYCLWRSSLEKPQAGQWDDFVQSLHSGQGLAEKVEAFRFAGEPATNAEGSMPGPSAYPRELFKTALK